MVFDPSEKWPRAVGERFHAWWAQIGMTSKVNRGFGRICDEFIMGLIDVVHGFYEATYCREPPPAHVAMGMRDFYVDVT